MADATDRHEGWYVGRDEGTSPWKGGPYAWAELVAFAREGRVSASDLVWHATLPEWLPASEVSGLLTEVAAVPAARAAAAKPAGGTRSAERVGSEAMAEGWYVGRSESDWRGGPYSWDELVSYAREGRIAADDLVWHESCSDWVAPENVPGLMDAVRAAEAAPAAGRAPSAAHAAAPAPAAAPSADLAAKAGAAVATGSAASAAVSRVAAMASGGAGAAALPWQTIVSGQSVDVAGMLRAAAPSLLAKVPRPNLRRPALMMAFTVLMQIVIAALSGGAVNPGVLVLGIIPGLATAVLGVMTGSDAGAKRKATAVMALLTAVMQLVTVIAGLAAAGGSSTFLSVLPSIVAALSGLLLAATTALAGWRT